MNLLKTEFRTTGLEASPAVGVTGPQGVKLFLQGWSSTPRGVLASPPTAQLLCTPNSSPTG